MNNEDNFLFISNLCKNINAEISFLENEKGIIAIMSKKSDLTNNYEISSLPKKDKDTACLSIMKQLLFSDIAKFIGIPETSSLNELKLKINILFPA